MNRRLFVGALGAGLGFVFVPRLPRRRADDVFVERWSWAMGQPVHVMVFAGSEQEGLEACAAALAELRRWGFHRHRASAPTAAELAEAREAVLAAVVELDGDVARLPSAHTQLDFGAIGVGYGIDRAVELLRARGLRRAFIDVSGDMAAIGTPPGEPGWRVDIADPDQPGAGRAAATTRLRDAALATAANTESIVRYGSLVAGHVMDPKTGWPARALKQATVVTGSAVAADALSTAMLVAGRTPGGVRRAYRV